MADATVRIFVPIRRYFTPLNRAARQMLRERSQDSLYAAERMLGVYKNFVCFYVNDQSAVCDFRAVVLFMRGIRTRNNSRWSSRISLAERVSPSLHRIFFISFCFADRLGFGRPLSRPFMRYTAYSQVGTARSLFCVNRRAAHKPLTC